MRSKLIKMEQVRAVRTIIADRGPICCEGIVEHLIDKYGQTHVSNLTRWQVSKIIQTKLKDKPKRKRVSNRMVYWYG